jgi:hypothetical protein
MDALQARAKVAMMLQTILMRRARSQAIGQMFRHGAVQRASSP